MSQNNIVVALFYIMICVRGFCHVGQRDTVEFDSSKIGITFGLFCCLLVCKGFLEVLIRLFL